MIKTRSMLRVVAAFVFVGFSTFAGSIIAQETRSDAAADETSARPTAPEIISASSYPFTFASGSLLDDMSSGTTQLVASSQDDTVSAVTNIGFEFRLDGVRYTQFSVNSNGLMRLGGTVVSASNSNSFATPGDLPKLSAYWDDLCTGTTGKAHYKVVGSAPNRRLIIEWANMVQFDNVGVVCSATPLGTFQVALTETTGLIEMTYGNIGTNIDSGGAGFSTGMRSAGGTFASVTTTAVPTVSYAASNDTMLNGITAGTKYSLTPNVPATPTGLFFSGVGPTSMTLNWTDVATNEIGYEVYQSTDNVNFSFYTQTAANATSQSVTGLTPSTTYFFRVIAVSEGAQSSSLTGSQATPSPGIISSTAGGGPWSQTSTWSGGFVPTSADNVTIVDGATVTLDIDANALSVSIGSGGLPAVLQFEATTARTLTVGTDVTVAANSRFVTASSGSQTNHVLSVGGNLTNNGIFDFSTSGNAAGAGITFIGQSNNTFGGSGLTTDIRSITVNKGNSSSNVLDLNAANFTVQGSATDSAAAAFLTLTNGTFKISGTFAANFRTFSSAAYTIGSSCGFWLNNPNYVVSAQAGTQTINGLLRVSNGTFNAGAVVGDAVGAGAGAAFVVEGGTSNFAGRLQTGNAVSYTQSAGTVNVSTVGNAAINLASFGFSNSSNILNITGGTINLVQANTSATTPLDYILAGTGPLTGAILNVGTSATAVNFSFRIQGGVPNLTIDNAGSGKTAILLATTTTNGNTNILAGSTLFLNAFQYSQAGTNFVNNGTLNGSVGTGRLRFLGSTPQTYSGNGVVTPTLGQFNCSNATGLTIDPGVNQIVTNFIGLFRGTITNSNKLTLGNGGATSSTIQVGLFGTPGGNLDVAPVFNLGAGGQNVNYTEEGVPRTTGPEINPTRTVSTLFSNNSGNLTIAGGDLTVNSSLQMVAGHVITGTNTLAFACNASVAGAGSGLYVDGQVKKTFCTPGVFSFPVGSNDYTPVTANVTAVVNPSSLTARSFGTRLSPFTAATAIARNWDITKVGTLTADLSFTFLPGDNPGGLTDLRVWREESGGVVTNLCPGGPCIAGTLLGPANGVSTFSRWTGAGPLAPSAATASISGRVTTADGRGIRNALVVLTGNGLSQPLVISTGSFGYYRFDGLAVGETYIATVNAKRFAFSSPARVLSLSDSVQGIDFVADPEP